ncbi:MAG: hypothetical protein PGN13_12610 [Patulibacter minatonensis]
MTALDANWAGWAGYAPTVRGPELRRARAEAAGILDPAPVAASTLPAPGPAPTVAPEARQPPLPPRCAARHRASPSRRLARA